MMRKNNYGKRSVYQRVEKAVIRSMIFCTVLLAVFQLKYITNPVDFYLKFAGDIDSPAFRYDQYVNETPSSTAKTSGVRLSFRTIPENAPVIVRQHENILGVIERDKVFTVEPGIVSLDATQIIEPVTVDILLNDKSYSIQLHRDQKSFEVQLKSTAAS